MANLMKFGIDPNDFLMETEARKEPKEATVKAAPTGKAAEDPKKETEVGEDEYYSSHSFKLTRGNYEYLVKEGGVRQMSMQAFLNEILKEYRSLPEHVTYTAYPAEFIDRILQKSRERIAFVRKTLHKK